jgi:hypothetical protein
MIVQRPTPDQERWLRITARLALPRLAPEVAARTGGWKSVSPLARSALFVLGIVAAALSLAIGELLHVPSFLVVVGVALLAAAEWFSAPRHFFSCGIEEALGLVGLAAVAVQFQEWIGGVHDLGMSLLIAAVFAVAGIRFLNPLFITVAAVLLSFAVYFSQALAAVPASVLASCFCFAVAAGALLLGAKQFRRPAHEQMTRWLMVTLPWCAYLWVAGISWSLNVAIGVPVLSPASAVALLGPMTLGVLALLAGLKRRAHAPLMTFMVCLACVVIELHHYIRLSTQARLIAGGCILLAVAIALERALRTPHRGITARRLTGDVGVADLLSIAGAAALAPAAPASAADRIRGGGGEFGGGGASGRY